MDGHKIFPNNFEWFLMKTLSFWNIGRIHFQIPKNKNRSQRLSQKIEVCLKCRDNGAKRLNFVGLQRRMLPNIPGRSWNPNDERVIWSLVGVKIPSQLLWRLGLVVSSHTPIMLLQSLVEGLQQQQNVGLLPIRWYHSPILKIVHYFGSIRQILFEMEILRVERKKNSMSFKSAK